MAPANRNPKVSSSGEMYFVCSENEAGLFRKCMEIASYVQSHRGCVFSPQLSLNINNKLCREYEDSNMLLNCSIFSLNSKAAAAAVAFYSSITESQS